MNQTTPLGRYALHGVVGAGGMATVHVARRYGAEGFRSTVAIKRLTPDLVEFPEAVTMLADEARIASRIQHANVVPVHDVVVENDELFLVMEHIMGVSLMQLIRGALQRKEPMPPPIVRAIVVGMLRGLEAAHRALDDEGRPLGIIHRDVSPSNVIVGTDGVARLVDFGIAKAKDRSTHTQHGERKGKLGFMPPEQVRGEVLDARADVYAAGVVYWETLVQKRLHKGDDAEEILGKMVHGNVMPPSALVAEVSAEDDAIVRKALRPLPQERFATAAEMANAIERGCVVAPASEVAAYVSAVCATELEGRKKLLEEMNGNQPIMWIGGAPSIRKSAASLPGPLTGPHLPPQVTFVTPPPAARWPYALAAVGTGALVAVLVLAFRAPTRVERSSTEPAPPPMPTVPFVPAPPPAEPAPPPTLTETPTPPPPKPKPIVRPPGRPASCNPPFVIDSQGVKVYKEECLR